MSAKYCNIIKAIKLGPFLILFMSWTHSTFFEKYKKFPRDGNCRKPRLGFATLWCSLSPRNPDDSGKTFATFQNCDDHKDQRGVAPAVLRWMGTQWVQMKGVLPRLVRWAWFLFCLGCSNMPSTKYFFPHRTLGFQFLCPHLPASWAGSRAGSPFS